MYCPKCKATVPANAAACPSCGVEFAAQAPKEYQICGMVLVGLPAGEFFMGSAKEDADATACEKPLHRVCIARGFYLGKYPVMQHEYAAVMGENPSENKGKTLPVDSVSWEHAVKFCERLSAKAGMLVRLPTEAEWEYACRAGTQTSYYFGNHAGALGAHAWFADNSEGQGHSVGQKKPNAWGFHDMLGNVWEWCADWFDERYYASSPERNPTGPASGKTRVIRGGSWDDFAGLLRCAIRDGVDPKTNWGPYGLRVCTNGQRLVNPRPE